MLQDHTAPCGPSPVRPDPDDFEPTPLDALWWFGFTLGLVGILANPPADHSDAERAAFVAGHDIGHARFVEDCERDHKEAMDRDDWSHFDPWDNLNEAERHQAAGSVDVRRHAVAGGGDSW